MIEVKMFQSYMVTKGDEPSLSNFVTLVTF
jgi:hypothetical protein